MYFALELGANPIGLVLGLSLIVPATIWVAWRTVPRPVSRPKRLMCRRPTIPAGMSGIRGSLASASSTVKTTSAPGKNEGTLVTIYRPPAECRSPDRYPSRGTRLAGAPWVRGSF